MTNVVFIFKTKYRTEKLAYLCACVLRMAVHVSQHAGKRIYFCINISKMFIRPTCLKMRRSNKISNTYSNTLISCNSDAKQKKELSCFERVPRNLN